MRISLKRFILFGGIAFALFVAYMAYQLLAPARPISVSPQTTVITEPLADDGLPDYAAHLLAEMKEGVTPENNGAIPFLQAMWPAGLPPQHQSVVCRELQMEIPESPGMIHPETDGKLLNRLVTWYAAQSTDPELLDNSALHEQDIKQWVRDEVFKHCRENPWTASDVGPLAEWLDAHGQHFELLHEAARRDRFYLPPASLLVDPNASFIHVMLSPMNDLRSAVRCLNLRGLQHVGNGDLDSAWKDARAMYQLASLPAGLWLVGDLVSIACEGQAHALTMQILSSDKLTRSTAVDILRFLHDRPFHDSTEHTIDRSERLFFVTSVLELSRARSSNDPNAVNTFQQFGPLVSSLQHLAIDWDLLLTIGNQWYDEIVAATELPTHAERQAAYSAIETKLQQQSKVTPGKVLGSALSRTSRSKSVANVLSNLLLPSVMAAKEAEDRANTLLQLQQTAAALAVYRSEHGDYPEALTPELMDTVPEDPYGNPLVYQKTSRGYLLFSLGRNGTDDGGSNESYSKYQGYELGETEDEDRAVRELIGEPPIDVESDETVYEFLQVPKDSDDQSLRLPLLRRPLTKFEPAAVGEY